MGSPAGLSNRLGSGDRSGGGRRLFLLPVIWNKIPTGFAGAYCRKGRKGGYVALGANYMGFYTPPLACAWPAPPHRKGCNRAALPDRAVRPALAHYHIMTGDLVSPCGIHRHGTCATVTDYMEWALYQPETRVIGLFIETIRDPAGFLRILALARQREVPVVALKVGRTAKVPGWRVAYWGNRR